MFEAASTFKDQCAAPRSGVDIEGNAFPDQAGALIDELFWLRSWTTGLMPDQVKQAFGVPILENTGG